ncbi:MAG: transporter substrate-binding domain-containing protein [Rhodocyclaceae bacterium]|nr:transporter substrate-binding domain-containing protein [Rhodocyclaceae bacterium]
MKRFLRFAAIALFAAVGCAQAQDLSDIKASGVLRHLGIPYANFVSGNGDGLDVEITQLFAKHLGVRYEYVKTDWKDVIGDLTGKLIEAKPEPHEVGSRPIKGDLIGNGFTMLEARKKWVDYSDPTFPTSVWLVARADSKTKPIKPSGDKQKDIATTKTLLSRGSTFVMENSCLDPKLYDIGSKGYQLKFYTLSSNLNELIPAVLKGDADMTLLDVPDIMVAMQKWPGQFKIIGPISDDQLMGTAFRKTSPELRAAFNSFLEGIKKDGTYGKLVKKYYPMSPKFYPDYFKNVKGMGGK